MRVSSRSGSGLHGVPAVVERTSPAVASAAAAFRESLQALIEPGGITRDNVAEVSRWFDGPAFDLIDANEDVTASIARGPAQ